MIKSKFTISLVSILACLSALFCMISFTLSANLSAHANDENISVHLTSYFEPGTYRFIETLVPVEEMENPEGEFYYRFNCLVGGTICDAIGIYLDTANNDNYMYYDLYYLEDYTFSEETVYNNGRWTTSLNTPEHGNISDPRIFVFNGGYIDVILFDFLMANTVLDTSVYQDGYTAGFEAGETSGYNEGFDDGKTQGFDKGYADGLVDGRTDGYEDGYNEGSSDGYEYGFQSGKSEGFEEGRTEGYETGYNEGNSAGRSEGFEEGRTQGYETGYKQGLTEGKDSGFEEGRTVGFNEGYNKGSFDAASSSKQWYSYILSIADVPFNVIFNMLNFDLLGVNISSFVLSLISVAVVITILKMLL